MNFDQLSYEDALSIFYNSDTYQLISNGIADMHCFSDAYLAEELEIEWKNSKSGEAK